MEALKTIPYVFLILAIAGIIAGASVLTVSKFGNTMTQCTAGVYNSTYGSDYICVNATNPSSAIGNTTDEFRTTLLANEGLSTSTEQFPTIAIIAIMSIVVGVLSSVFIYLNYFR